jgi:hypothetical protein
MSLRKATRKKPCNEGDRGAVTEAASVANDLTTGLAAVVSSSIPEWAGSGSVVIASVLGIVSVNRWFNVFACLSRSVNGDNPKLLSIVARTEV